MSGRRQATDILVQAAVFAGQAPSLHNSQPWQWVVDGDELRLTLAAERLLHSTVAETQLAVLSCGAALHHARTDLAALGRQATVDRLPEPADTELLARVRLGARIAVDPTAARLAQAAHHRRTDRRSVPAAPLDFDKLRSVRDAVRHEGADLKLLRPGQVFTLAGAADRANGVERGDPGRQLELGHWIGEARMPGTGIPPEALPASRWSASTPERAFRRAGDALISESHYHASVFAVLFGPGDGRRDWLIAGEGLSAGWLTSTLLDVSLLPLSIVVEEPSTRRTIRRLLGGAGLPYLVLRFAAADPDHQAGSRRTERLPAEATVQVRERPGQ